MWTIYSSEKIITSHFEKTTVRVPTVPRHLRSSCAEDSCNAHLLVYICYRRKKESSKYRCTLTCASSLHSLHFFTTPSRFCLFLPPNATLHPSLDNKIPVAAPIPELAPEMHNRMTGFTISPKYLDLNPPNLPVSNIIMHEQCWENW